MTSPVPYERQVGDRLRAIRASRGLSLMDVQDKSGGKWKAAAVGTYERGDRNINVRTLSELARFYGVHPAVFLPEGDAPGLPLAALLELLEAAKYLAAALPDLETLVDTATESTPS
jgi:transcriptional regulator with XRE-family HTH domain